MVVLTSVFAGEGQKGLLGPAPSSCMEVGIVIVRLEILWLGA